MLQISHVAFQERQRAEAYKVWESHEMDRRAADWSAAEDQLRREGIIQPTKDEIAARATEIYNRRKDLTAGQDWSTGGLYVRYHYEVVA
ncbi:MAG: hypothetical protein KGI59_03085 [Patescibacteria group bacterium]|nr:hypothetical protein [Patescibacteria group bacterium]